MSLGQEILVWSGDKRSFWGTPVEDENTDQKEFTLEDIIMQEVYS